MWDKLGRESDVHRVGGYNPLQSVCDATALGAQDYAPQGGRPIKWGHEVVVVEAEESHPPTPRLRVKPPSLPKPSKVAKVAAQPPPPPARS